MMIEYDISTDEEGIILIPTNALTEYYNKWTQKTYTSDKDKNLINYITNKQRKILLANCSLNKIKINKEIKDNRICINDITIEFKTNDESTIKYSTSGHVFIQNIVPQINNNVHLQEFIDTIYLEVINNKEVLKKILEISEEPEGENENDVGN